MVKGFALFSLVAVREKQVIQCCQLWLDYTLLDFSICFFVFSFLFPQPTSVLKTTCHLTSLLLVSIRLILALSEYSPFYSATLYVFLPYRKLLCKTCHEHKPVSLIFMVGKYRAGEIEQY